MSGWISPARAERRLIDEMRSVSGKRSETRRDYGLCRCVRRFVAGHRRDENVPLEQRAPHGLLILLHASAEELVAERLGSFSPLLC